MRFSARGGIVAIAEEDGVMKRILTTFLFLGVIATGSLRADALCPDTTPFGGQATACGTIINITDNGSGGLTFTVTDPGNGNPFDAIGGDDTLIGVQNNTAATTIEAITLSSSLGIFAFDNDGMCAFYGAGPIGTNGCSAAGAAGTDPDDYSGTQVTLTCTDCVGFTAGTAAFLGGLAPGATQFFSLEEDLVGAGNGGSITVTGTPEPGTIVLLLGGLGALAVGRRRLTSK
jgi:hypothetical protein